MIIIVSENLISLRCVSKVPESQDFTAINYLQCPDLDFISRMLSSPYSEANGRHRRQPHEEPPASRRTLSAGSR